MSVVHAITNCSTAKHSTWNTSTALSPVLETTNTELRTARQPRSTKDRAHNLTPKAGRQGTSKDPNWCTSSKLWKQQLHAVSHQLFLLNECPHSNILRLESQLPEACIITIAMPKSQADLRQIGKAVPCPPAGVTGGKKSTGLDSKLSSIELFVKISIF